jgi:hypothetical protein
MNTIPCPTCGAVGTQMCRRGRLPSVIWQKNIPFPQGHDSRRSINEKER